ncbi:MAG: metallophosphoesterase [Terriglobus sp.]
MLDQTLTRRTFLRQTFAYSAAALGSSLLGFGDAPTVIANPTKQVNHLLMVGDWGTEGNLPAQTAVAQSMQTYMAAQKINVEALLMLGDNFYGPLQGTDDTRWQTQFEQMYPASVFNCPAYAIPGNHDYEHFPNPKYPYELQYAQRTGTRWTMPSQWYTFTFPTINPLVTVIALDSNMPFTDGTSRHGTFYCMTDQMRQDQLEWLTLELQKPRTTPFTVVMGHHPVYSNGIHGDNPTLIKDWDPLLRQYGVHIYLGGHDHDMQHLEFAGHPTSFFLSGGGGANSYPLPATPNHNGQYAQQVYGFSHMEATATLLTLRHIDVSGKVLHAFTKAKDSTVTIL